jgi:hypothetical protein
MKSPKLWTRNMSTKKKEYINDTKLLEEQAASAKERTTGNVQRKSTMMSSTITMRQNKMQKLLIQMWLP